ncbi:hypothetical protein QJS10_CPB22g00888 [Acorus calamus]|uniref:Uncharacterized protein n=1 Tax=Acorus calamus TaxID=4465 RepID=A0AAV9BZ52_ACOCL|nr:hypothetical protein QJS10_CPB22g00888 [Acorus calamus]
MEKPIEEDAAIESSSDSSDDSPNPIPIPIPNPSARSADAKPPEVEVHLYRCGKGPVEVFKCPLGGWGQDQLEVQDILDKHGLKSIYAFNPASGRAAPIRFNGRNGRSLLTYRDGAVICVDGQPKVIAFLISGLSFQLVCHEKM